LSVSIKLYFMSENKEDICPKYEKCPLFNGEILTSEKATEIYKKIYCKAGEKGRNRCKRFMLVKEGYKPSHDLMPNDERSVEQIIKDM